MVAASFNTYALQILSGLGSAAYLFLVASGLTLIFGALRLVNFAHGSLYMVGAFVTFTIAGIFGTGNVAFFGAVLVGALVVAAIGLLMEVAIFRQIYKRSVLTQLIVTFACVLIIDGVMRGIYGAGSRLTSTPPFLRGGVAMFGSRFAIYDLFLMGLAVLVAVALWLLLSKSRTGRMIRAAVGDVELLAFAGVNVSWLFTGVFVIGCFLAGLAGGVNGSIGGIDLGIDVDVILRAFVVIVIGGLGSVGGAFVASILVGVVEALGILWVPQASLAIVFALLVAVLAVRPQGLFGSRVL